MPPIPDYHLRFVCDHDVDAAVARALRKLGHDAWTAWEGAMSEVSDDELAVYTDNRDAIIVTHDREFSQRRRRFVTTSHIWLNCNEWDGAALLRERLPDLERLLANRSKPIFAAISQNGVDWTF